MSKNLIYELTFLVSGELDETKAQETGKKITEIIASIGQIFGALEPKKIKLSYPIKKQLEGFLFSLDFTAQPKEILTIAKTLEKNEEILRFITIKKSPAKIEEEKKPEIKETIQEEKEESEAPRIEIIKKAEKEQVKEPAKKEKVKKEKTKEAKEEDLKKIEEDLDKILGQ